MACNVFYCKICNMTWGLCEIAASEKDRDNWTCPACDKSDINKTNGSEVYCYEKTMKATYGDDWKPRS